MWAPLTRTRGVDPVGGRAPVGEGVGQLVMAVEGAVDDHQRQVALAAGSGSPASNSSSTIHIPASPRQTLRAVWSRRWSWYHWKAARSGRPSSIRS